MTNPGNSTSLPSQKAHTLFSLQALLVILLAAVAIEVLVLWRLGLSFKNGEAVAATVTSIMMLVTFAEFVRRRFRISLKAWFLLFTILAVGIGLFAQRLINSRKQSHIASRIQQLGGHVEFDYNSDLDDWLTTSDGMPVPKWMRGLLGDGMFARVTHVSLSGSQLQDRDLMNITDTLRGLEGVYLYNSSITDRGVAHLTNLRSLSAVSIGGDQATEYGIKSLGELPHVEKVVLRGRQVTDQNLAHLRHLKRLRRLTLWDTNVSDAGLIHLRELQKMERISFFRTLVTQQGVNQLKAAMPNVVITDW